MFSAVCHLGRQTPHRHIGECAGRRGYARACRRSAAIAQPSSAASRAVITFARILPDVSGRGTDGSTAAALSPEAHGP
jgi:hypothetical protein